jgi:lysylphosphatidylglycerol synthetase-like protein (DUF2156 family)
MHKRPLSVSINLFFILLNALVWLVFGSIVALHAHPSLPDDPIILGAMAVLSFGATGILLALAFSLWKRIRLAWFAALGFLALTAILAIFDDFGWSDLVVLVINLIPILLLVKDRAWYLRRKPAVTGQAAP